MRQQRSHHASLWNRVLPVTGPAHTVSFVEYLRRLLNCLLQTVSCLGRLHCEARPEPPSSSAYWGLDMVQEEAVAITLFPMLPQNVTGPEHCRFHSLCIRLHLSELTITVSSPSHQVISR
jgi:hypothetical protein